MVRTASAKKRKREVEAQRANNSNRPVDLAADGDWDNTDSQVHWDVAEDQYRRFHALKKIMSGDELDRFLDRIEAGEKYVDLQRQIDEPDYERHAPEPEDDATDAVDAAPAQSEEQRADEERQPQPNATTAARTTSSAPFNPAALGISDASIQNLMMSWYWAGYYAGFHEGQTKAAAEPTAVANATGLPDGTARRRSAAEPDGGMAYSSAGEKGHGAPSSALEDGEYDSAADEYFSSDFSSRCVD